MAEVTFLRQHEPVDEHGRALYAVTRSIIRALLDQLGQEDLVNLNCDRGDVTMRQLAKVARLDRDKGMRGDGFEWAVHEAVVGGEPRVCGIVADVLSRASRHLEAVEQPTSLLFGHERAKYLGFTDAVIQNAGEHAVLLPDGRGHPFDFGPWVAVAAQGKAAEDRLGDRIKQIWKTDLFLSNQESRKYVAATIKSNWHQLEGGRGLRIGIVPEARDLQKGITWDEKCGLWVAVLPDPDGFMGLFNDAYMAVAAAICKLGRHDKPYWAVPSATAQRIQDQLERYESVKVIEIEAGLNQAAQVNLVDVEHRLVSVAAPEWLHMNEQRTKVVAPRPSFERL
ncbi:MAG: hypothetical protein QM704_21580 [Anaeromyxobacteraceae bacterium]